MQQFGKITTRRSISASTTTFRWWNHVQQAAKDPISSATEAFLSDPSSVKINLVTGSHRDDEGKPLVLECVRKAEAMIIGGTKFLNSTSAAAGSKLIEESAKLAFGKDSDVVREKRVAGIQALSGTGACRLFAELQRRFHPESRIYLPAPTWTNHVNIWRDANIRRSSYQYYNPSTKGLDFSALAGDIKNAPDGSFFLLHPCAHNPTGIDPTPEQWQEISHLFKVKNHFPFFDMAYQGLASGDIERDALAIRIFVKDGHLVGCAQSFAKNMGLGGHRVSCLRLSQVKNLKDLINWTNNLTCILCEDLKQVTAVKSQLQQIAKAMYGSPPVHGALLVSTILSDPSLRTLWQEEVELLVKQITDMRTTLCRTLEEVNPSISWKHITHQVGMFCFSGLSSEQIEELERNFHVYMTRDGRISMAGVTAKNVEYIANAIHKVTRRKN